MTAGYQIRGSGAALECLRALGRNVALTAASAFLLLPACGAERPFFVTYTTQLEEPRDLEIEDRSIAGSPKGGNGFVATALEFEYGVTAWWTSELYLDWQATRNQSAFFTGYRWENRFQFLERQHWINPALYFEFENLNGADKTLLEIVGNDGIEHLITPNDEARREKEREIETKLLLSSYFKRWTVSENFIAVKNLDNSPWEFGYAVGVSRPLAVSARPYRCYFCPENFQVGVEVFGGLGTTAGFGFHDTSHYVGPVIAWEPPSGPSFRVSPNFGLTGTSAGFLFRFGVTYEVTQFGRKVQNLFRGAH